MNKITKFNIAVITLIILLFTFSSCGTPDKPEITKPTDFPKALEPVRKEALTLAKDYAKKLEGEWVDRQDLLISQNLGDSTLESYEYQSLKSNLDGFMAEGKAFRIYTMVTGENDNYCIAIDSLETPSGWMESVEKEDSMTEAKEYGLVSSCHSGKKVDDTYVWLAYAPLYNSEGKISGILCVEVAAPKLAENEEWVK